MSLFSTQPTDLQASTVIFILFLVFLSPWPVLTSVVNGVSLASLISFVTLCTFANGLPIAIPFPSPTLLLPSVAKLQGPGPPDKSVPQWLND